MQARDDRGGRGHEGGRGLPLRRALAALAFAALVLVAPAARAHTVGLSRGDYTVEGRAVRAELVFAAQDVADPLALAGALAVRANGRACPSAGASVDRAPTPDGGEVANVHARFACEADPWRVTIELPMTALPEGHQHAAVVRWGALERPKVLTRDDPSVSVAPDDAPVPGFFAFVPAGVRHIATGWDHMLFLVALLLVRARARSIAVTVTAFTVAHSVTLALAATGVFVPSARIVEPAIAASVGWVGFENLFVKSGDGRWRITFPFGLVHGFGFASALAELELPRRALAGALAGFNVGVELGQLVVVAIAWPILWRLWRVPVFERRLAKVASALVGALGIVWFVTRVLGV